MTSLADVVAQLQDALAKAAEAQAALRQAGMFAQNAIDLVKPVGVGSVHEADYEQVSAEWACVVEVPAKLDEVLDAACGTSRAVPVGVDRRRCSVSTRSRPSACRIEPWSRTFHGRSPL